MTVCEFHRCDLPATIIFTWPDRQKAACDGHAVEFYRASLDPQPMNSIAGTIERGAMTKPDDGRTHKSWRERLYKNLGRSVSPLIPYEQRSSIKPWPGWPNAWCRAGSYTLLR